MNLSLWRVIVIVMIFSGLTAVSPSLASAARDQKCDVQDVGHCNVCTDSQICLENAIPGGYSCQDRTTAHNCNISDLMMCDATHEGKCGGANICPFTTQKCTNQSGVYNCVYDPSCGATQQNTCNASTVDRSDVCSSDNLICRLDVNAVYSCVWTDKANWVNFDLCSQTTNGVDKQACIDCISGTNFGTTKTGVWTAVGCIQADPKPIVQAVVTIGVGLAGGIALLMVLVGGFMMTISQGNPKQWQEARDMITSAVIGLLFVLFSVVILQFIGVSVLHLPGFGTP